jgi:hypothetical protein
MFEFSPGMERKRMSFDLYNDVLLWLQQRFPLIALHSYIQKPPSPSSRPLPNIANFHDYVIVKRQRFMASSHRSGQNMDSLVNVKIGNATHVGQLCDILIMQTEMTGIQRIGQMKWFRPLTLPQIDQGWTEL